MVKVNVTNLSTCIEGMNQILEELDENKINLFNQLKNSCVNWQDGNYLKFDQEIYEEHKESDELYNEIKDKKEIYDYIHSKYAEFGKKVLCSVEDKDSLLNTMDEARALIMDAESELSGVTAINVNIIRNCMISAREQIGTLRELAKLTFIKIADYEKDISVKIDGLSTMKLKPFEFDVKIK